MANMSGIYLERRGELNRNPQSYTFPLRISTSAITHDVLVAHPLCTHFCRRYACLEPSRGSGVTLVAGRCNLHAGRETREQTREELGQMQRFTSDNEELGIADRFSHMRSLKGTATHIFTDVFTQARCSSRRWVEDERVGLYTLVFYTLVFKSATCAFTFCSYSGLLYLKALKGSSCVRRGIDRGMDADHAGGSEERTKHERRW